MLAPLKMWVICKTSARNENEKGSIEIVSDVADVSIFLLHEPGHNPNCIFFKPPCVQTISPTTAFEISRLKNEIKKHCFQSWGITPPKCGAMWCVLPINSSSLGLSSSYGTQKPAHQPQHFGDAPFSF